MMMFTSAYIAPDVIMGVSAAIAGVAVTIGAGVAVYFHRIKNKVNDKLGIDADANKEVEEDVTGNFDD